jgi:sialic acid synthase SpsE
MLDPQLDSLKREGRHGFYVAEIGLNHNGSLERALEMVDLAAGSGVDAVKFQTFMPEGMNSEFTASLLQGRGCSFVNRKEVDFFKELSFSKDQWRRIADRSREKGVIFFSTPFDSPSVDLLEDLDVPVMKVASSEVTNLPLLGRIGKTGKPVLLSTGMSRDEDINRALQHLEGSGSGQVTLLHCVSLYPCPDHHANIARVLALGKRYGRPLGLSDHTRSAMNAALAAACGARVFEKHFTIDREYACPDKDVSITAGDFRELIVTVENALIRLGTGELEPEKEEQETARAARRSLFAARDITRNSVITEEDLVLLRPGTGIPASEIGRVLGRKAARPIRARCIITNDDLV